MPKVLVSDKLSEESVKIFKDKNIDVDYLPDIGKDKEKLAEIVVMTKKGRPEKAKIALQYYFDYLNKALAEQNNEDASPKDKNHLKFLNAILEHRYILGIEYTELSEHAAHEIIEQTNANLMLLYKQIEVQIPVSLTDSLFFKKDEVNWIWEIANENKVRF